MITGGFGFSWFQVCFHVFFTVTGQFLWFLTTPVRFSWFFTVPNCFLMVSGHFFQGSNLVFIVPGGFFYGFHGSRLFFMVPGWRFDDSRLVFMFFTVPG